MGTATYLRKANDIRRTAAAAVAAGDVQQLSDGRAGIYDSSTGASTGDQTAWRITDQWVLPKTAGISLLAGGRAFWCHATGLVHFKKQNDQDYYLGRVVDDAASADANANIAINVDQVYDLDLSSKAFRSALIGTQAAGGFGGPYRRGNANKLILSATNEAQKVDALGKDGCAIGANAIVEAGIEVVSLGAGTSPVFCFGLASGTHATAVTSITNYIVCRIDGNVNKIQFQSSDGTHTVAETDSTKTLTAGTRFEVWFDLRDPTNVKLYVDGVQVLTGTTFNMSSTSNTLLLLAHLVKTATTDTFEVDVDWLRARTMEW